MALTARPIFRSPVQFAGDALKRAKIGVYSVERVLPPQDTGDDLEVLFHDEFKRPCCARVSEAQGEVLGWRVGW